MPSTGAPSRNRFTPQRWISSFLAATLLSVPAVVPAAELSGETLNAWQRYIQAADAQTRSHLDPGANFMWIGQTPGLRERIRAGGIVAGPMQGHGSEAVAGGLIHDWIGAAFIPNTTLDKFLAVIRDYDRYQDFYDPNVADSHALLRNGDSDRYSMRLLHKSGLFAYAVEAQADVRTLSVDDEHSYAISSAENIREIDGYGKPGEHELPPGEGAGFIWRLHSISRYEQRDGGVYVELRAIALSRDIPGSIRWMVGPMVAKMSRNSLLISLKQTREAVRSGQTPPPEVASEVRSNKRAARPGLTSGLLTSPGN